MVIWVKDHWLQFLKIFLFILILAALFVALIHFYGNNHNDWQHFFSGAFTHIQAPNKIDGFFNPPWTALLLVYGLLPLNISNVINLLLNICMLLAAVYKVKGGGWEQR